MYILYTNISVDKFHKDICVVCMCIYKYICMCVYMYFNTCLCICIYIYMCVLYFTQKSVLHTQFHMNV